MPSQIEILTLRKACNKIIHADTLPHNNDCNEGNCGLEPKITLSGSFNGKNWDAELDILKFVDCLHHNF